MTSSAIELLSFSMRATPPKDGEDWFRIVKAKKGEKATKVYVYDEIGFWGTNAKDFAALVDEIDTDEIHLHINSPGGSVFDGLAIYNTLKNHSAKVTGIVDGMAASAASFILQAADVRQISRNAQVMIHDAKAYAGGNEEQMRKAADLLGRISNEIADIYAVNSGGTMTAEEFRDIMKSGDQWYNGNEAVEAGLVDEVTDNPDEEEDAPEEANNSWSSTEVEAFLQTPSHKLAANADHITITNRVEEAPMSGTSPQKQTPPAVPSPPAPAAQQVTFPEALTGFVVSNDGQQVLDMQAVAAHIEGLENFKKETIEGARKDFVASLAKDGKIMANDETLKDTEDFALSLTSEQFGKWKASMSAAPASSLFARHGVEPGDTKSPSNGGAASDLAREITVLEETVQSHRDSGMDESVLATKESYKRLQQLKSQQSTGA